MSSKFLHRELKDLPRFIRRHGPLSNPTVPNAVVLPNPFLPWRNPKTGRWAPSKYSLRQQAELIKKAKATDTLHLLPPGVKLPQPELFAPPPPAPAGKAKVEQQRAKADPAASKEPSSSGKAKAKAKGGVKADAKGSAKADAKGSAKADVKGDVKAEVKAAPRKTLNVTVEWDRRPVVKNVPGADEGARLYAAKKKMFKGSRLERSIKQRAWRTWVLLHDMRRRIRKYRTNYVHKKPNPLRPSRSAARKLPY
ncbi:hypothetical protein C8R46DRAFT_1208514 [Mycena filopes]|nr:hypothetical protein C8R46DRAFT_1208514 [Mycena filopes]